ncbi:MAG: transporter related [Caloramator sp.]|jgi:ABC-2 type transport system ATP-binding protein|uniref:ABC-2 type transport system ATP-binding protein n=1 Tax=Caloramator proteoclasticus DSM 10124 TaxID=1121262 RepID=A0A1M4YSX8_9CLOT|nr:MULTISPECIES: ABC transporter ATP-binding protein [Caloramator]MBZ4663169.1 transporter related [Caloramator sp.]SHF08687.1 ABC-2 type transport system ATP-binding protein [Caloramator proteoclasticus DSM 10124]
MNSLEVKSVTKIIKNKKILNNISLEANDGQVVGLIGPNGSGKSTLFKVITNIYNPTIGKVFVDNIDLQKEYEKISSEIGFLIEEPSLYENLTGKENLMLISKLYNKFDSNIFEEVCNELEINKFLNVRFNKCSMGMKQKIGIAAAIIHNPKYIILDEPTNSLDAESIIKFKRLIKTLATRGKTIILSSHILSDVEEICDKIYILQNGEIIDCINNQENKHCIQYLIYTEKFNLRIDQIPIIEKDGQKVLIVKEEQLNDILNMLSRNNIRIFKIQEKRNTLQEKFIERIGYNECD